MEGRDRFYLNSLVFFLQLKRNKENRSGADHFVFIVSYLFN